MAAARASGAIPIPDERIVGEVAGRGSLPARAEQLQRQGRRDRLLLGRPAVVPGRGQPAARRGRGLLRRLRRRDPARGHPLHGSPPLVDRAGDLSCPLLGLFGAEDQHPSPEQVAELEKALKAHGKTYEFHTYDGAGHAFLQVDRPSYRPEAAVDAWQTHLGLLRPLPVIVRGWEGVAMCTYLTEKVSISGSGKGPSGWFRLTEASVYFDHPVHAQAEHTLNIDFLDPGAGPSARVAVELTAESARALAKAIQATLDSAPPGPGHLSLRSPVRPGSCLTPGADPRECQCLVPLCM